MANASAPKSRLRIRISELRQHCAQDDASRHKSILAQIDEIAGDVESLENRVAQIERSGVVGHGTPPLPYTDAPLAERYPDSAEQV